MCSIVNGLAGQPCQYHSRDPYILISLYRDPYILISWSLYPYINLAHIILVILMWMSRSYCRCLHLFQRCPERRNKEDAFKLPRQRKAGNIQAIKKVEEHIEGTLSCLEIYPALINLVVYIYIKVKIWSTVESHYVWMVSISNKYFLPAVKEQSYFILISALFWLVWMVKKSIC